MATVNKDFKIKSGLVVEGTTGTINGKDIVTAGIADAKGDLIVGSAADAVARLGVGTNGQVLTAASGATYGVQWSDPAAVGVFTENIVFEGATANDYETTLAVTEPTADRTITLPNATGTVALTSDITSAVDALTTSAIEEGTNEYFTVERAQDAVGNAVGTGLTYTDSTGAISVTANTYDSYGSASAVAGDLTTHMSDTSAHGVTGDVVGTTDTQTLTNKTLTSPKINENVVLTATASELNILDGATLTTTELNYVDGVTSAIQTQLDAKLALAGGTMTGAIAMGTNKITGLGTPTDGTDAATKAYVDAVSEGLHIHESARVAIDGNISIATGLENGDTAGGVTLVTGDRVLVKNQTTASENGIYVVQASGQALRATDFDTALEVDSGDFIFVTSGTYANTGWVQTLKPATIGTDPISFTQFSGAGTFLAGNGLTLTGNTFTIDTAITQTRVANVTDTEIGYLDGVTSAIQTQLDNKSTASKTETLTNKTINTASNDITVVAADISDVTASAAELNVLDGITASTVELNYVDGVTSAIQTQLDAKATPANITSAIDAITTSVIEEGTNQYFTSTRAKAAAAQLIVGATKTNITVTGDENGLTITAENGVADSNTDNLTEGATNKYFTAQRAVDALQAVVPEFTAVEINAVAKQVAATLSAPTAGIQVAHAFAKADYRSAEYLVKVAYSTHTEISKVLLTLDTSDNIAITEYGIVGTNGSAASISAGISGSNVQLQVTTANNNSTVTVVGTLLI